MKKFDTKVQLLRYKVLREVASHAWDDTLLENITDIPKVIVPDKSEPTMRCCIYKERAILGERVKLAIGGNKDNPNVIEVIEPACDECPVGGYSVTDACRGCLAHRCGEACKFGAITYDKNQKAHIDKSKCKECGLCAKSCPYTAIVHSLRPCQNSCKAKAISMNEDKSAKINGEKCTACGACIYQCPFGAISDKSYVLDAIKIIKESENNTKYNVYAMVAPSIASQFTYGTLGQVVKGIKELGFGKVIEVALGADMVAYKECQELAEKGFLTSSCCPAFVSYVEKNFPNMKENISHNLSPMAELGRFIKEKDANAKTVFIGPCTAKKMEFQKDSVREYVDSVITFEELQALLDSREIDVSTLEEDVMDNASYFGRIFARSGGLSEAVRQGLLERGLDFEFKPIACQGLDECKLALLKASKNILGCNFIEGMACSGGCVGGAGCLSHQTKNSAEVDKHGKQSAKESISQAVNDARE